MNLPNYVRQLQNRRSRSKIFANYVLTLFNIYVNTYIEYLTKYVLTYQKKVVPLQ